MPPPRLKRSNTANSAPASLEDGEIAVNQADGKLYYHTAAGGVGAVSSLPSSDSTMTGVLTVQPTSPPAVPGGSVQIIGDNQPAIASIYRYASVNGQAGFYINRMRGTRAAPEILQVNDNCGSFNFNSITTTGARAPAGYITATCTQSPVAGESFMRTQLAFAASDGSTQPVLLTISPTVSNFATSLTVGGTAVVVSSDARLTDARTPLAHTQAASTITDFATESAKYGPVTSVNGLTGAVTISAGGSISDGSKGDITVSGSGATWTINANAVGTAEIAGSAVTYAKIQNVSATDKLLGRATAGAGVVEEIACTAFGRSVIAGADAAAVRSTLNTVAKGGDTMTGGLEINAATPLSVSGGRSILAANSEPYGLGVKYVSTGGAVYFGATDGTATPGAQISKAGGSALMSWTNAGAASIPGTLTVGGSAVVVTTDSRLTDSRTPSTHKSTHSTGGSDALTPADIGALASGQTVICAAGSASACGVAPVGDLNTGLFFGDNVVNIATGGVRQVQVSSAGEVGIGTTARSNVRLAAWSNLTNAASSAGVQSECYTAASSSGSYSAFGTNTVASPDIASGVSNSGSLCGASVVALRNYTFSTDAGSLTFLRGMTVSYGHGSSNASGSPTTTQSIGLLINPYVGPGTQASMFDIYLAGDAYGTGTTTSRYGIYQAGANRQNYFAGSVGIGGAVSVAAGSAAAPSIAFPGDSNTGLYSPNTDTVAIATGGVERLRIAADGTVSIPGSLNVGNASFPTRGTIFALS